MAKLQYRKTGTGEVALYKCIWEAVGWWRLVEVLDYRKYETESKLNKHIVDMQKLYAKHDSQFETVLDAKEVIKETSTVDPYRSASFTAPLPKDSKKYCKRRAQPVHLWDSVRKAIIRARAHDVHETHSHTVESENEPELMAVQDQPVGKPARQRDGQTAKQKRRDNQHQ